MTLFNILFYAIAALIVVSTGLAVTRRNLVHAVIYLIISFFGSAFVFYLFGAPFLAAVMVIVYAEDCEERERRHGTKDAVYG